MKVALFATCLGDALYRDAVADAARLLRHLGVEVAVPPDQTCCGQPAFNAGYAAQARAAARHTVEVFGEADHVVLPSGSCAGMIRHHFSTVVPTAFATRVRRMAERTWELSQFLVHVLNVRSVGQGLDGVTVAYHHGCHAHRLLDLNREPVGLLEAAGACLLPWSMDRECCGFGGLFSVKLPRVSVAMADAKLDALPGVRPELEEDSHDPALEAPAEHAPTPQFVTSADAGCLLHMESRARVRGGVLAALPFVHLATLLWRATGKAEAA